jgi:ABC-2 type transport system permease protein
VSDLGLVVRQTAFNLKGFVRNPRALIFTIAMPIILLVLFNSIFASGSKSTSVRGVGSVALAEYYTAGIIAYAIMLAGFSSLLISLTTAREGGLLKRYRGTPMPPWVFLSAQILASVVNIVAMVVVLLAIGHFAYDVTIPTDTLPAFALYVLVGTATMCALGIAMTRFTPTADSAAAIGPFSTVILGFISGAFIPVATLPDWLAQIGRIFPLAHLAEGLQRALIPRLSGGNAFEAQNLAILALWGVASLVVAIRSFRWEPQGAEA